MSVLQSAGIDLRSVKHAVQEGPPHPMRMSQAPQSTVRKKMATGTFTYNALRTKTLKERIKTQRNIVSPSNSTRAMLLA